MKAALPASKPQVLKPQHRSPTGHAGLLGVVAPASQATSSCHACFRHFAKLCSQASARAIRNCLAFGQSGQEANFVHVEVHIPIGLEHFTRRASLQDLLCTQLAAKLLRRCPATLTPEAQQCPPLRDLEPLHATSQKQTTVRYQAALVCTAATNATIGTNPDLTSELAREPGLRQCKHRECTK